ncbi:MAG: type II toxin-antitoxin system PemK/MazF family toxin [Candidatus Kapabacteria bacterium]|nr:type II toxin-antitoxin system PemK/MazF family toxin [Candidatus Kapabacteria bacterium]
MLKRGMIIDCDLEPATGSETGKIRPCIVVTNDVYNSILPVIQIVPITSWTEKKSRIITNVILEPNDTNGLTKLSIADCLQTRPIDYSKRMKKVRGELESQTILKIDAAIKMVFQL